MATAPATTASSTVPSPEQALAELDEVRARTLALVAPLGEELLTRVHSPIMSPLVWDLGHIAAYEDLWLVHRHGERALLRPELAASYDAFETPRAVRGEIDALGVNDALAYLEQVRARSIEVITGRGLGDGVIYEMVRRHELQHTETMRQTLALAGLLADEDRKAAGRPLQGPPTLADAQAWLDVPAGTFEMGAPSGQFSYDNERPAHALTLGAFQIARQPVTAGMWMRFAAEGGYGRPELWSPRGWAWRQQQQVAQDPSIAAAHPDAPVCHVSWYEADAFARARGARLPTEAEWERAARLPDSPLRDIGRVWEWTSTCFGGYPGFTAHPYREYSEVFFGDAYRVLRGGSWATHPRVGTLTFRNWDLPERRQIFAGLRLATDPG
ncbi:MAG TPA: SUMF1/EgtB/PvdO family nonheme iron enzyme [Solirubrobacteraceae bacterium]|nr:SUMF1/EgtB/PvdO family nonheme iron enzyme [Solirubrobacteraceae bacterium]